MGLLAGKKTLVTGASKGIGRSIALKFAKEGADVAFTYLSSVEQAQALEEELAAFGGQVLAVCLDASDFEAAQELIAESLKAFGTLDVLVNNAGITKDNLLMRMSEEDFDRVLKVNLNSIFNTTKAVIRPMMKQKAGSIINISSVVGVKGNAGQANYAASAGRHHWFYQIHGARTGFEKYSLQCAGTRIH